jgi:hypothetical protein
MLSQRCPKSAIGGQRGAGAAPAGVVEDVITVSHPSRVRDLVAELRKFGVVAPGHAVGLVEQQQAAQQLVAVSG